MIVDLHLKTSRTPGVAFSPAEVAAKAKAEGLDGIAICDTLASAHAAEILAACESEGIAGFVGVEIPTNEGTLLCFAPNVDTFYASEEWRALTELATPAASLVIDLFNELGGAVIASRPYDLDATQSMGDMIFTLKGLAGVEVFNSRVRPIQADFAFEAASAMNLPTAGGTAPNGSLSDVGKFATLFTADVKTQSDFVSALRGGDYYAVAIGVKAQRSERPPREDRPRDDRRDDRGPRRDDRGPRRDDRGGRRDDRGGRNGGGGGRDRGRRR